MGKAGKRKALEPGKNDEKVKQPAEQKGDTQEDEHRTGGRGEEGQGHDEGEIEYGEEEGGLVTVFSVFVLEHRFHVEV